MAASPLRVNPTPNEGPSDPSIRRITALCDMHGLHHGTSADLPAFMQAITANKHLAMDFWTAVANISDQAAAGSSLPAINGHILELTVNAITGRSVAEMVAAGSDQRRLVGDLGGLLAGEDISSPANAPSTLPPPPDEPESEPTDIDVEKLRADFEDLRAAFESRFGAARFGTPMTRSAPPPQPQPRAPISAPVPAPEELPPGIIRAEVRATPPAVLPPAPARDIAYEPAHNLPQPVHHESEAFDDSPLATDFELPAELLPYAATPASRTRQQPPPDDLPPEFLYKYASPPARPLQPPAPPTSAAPKIEPPQPSPPHPHPQSFAAALAAMPLSPPISEPPNPVVLPVSRNAQQITPPTPQPYALINPHLQQDALPITPPALPVLPPEPAPVSIAPLPLLPVKRRFPIVPVLATLLFLALYAVAYFAWRAGKLDLRELSALIPAHARENSSSFTPEQPAPESATTPGGNPLPSSSAATATPWPTLPRPQSPNLQPSNLQPTSLQSTSLRPAVPAKPEPAIDRGLNTPAVLPRHFTIVNEADTTPPPTPVTVAGMGRAGNAPLAAMGNLSTAAAPIVRVAPPPPPTQPLLVSSGVMAGQKISGRNPDYPAWARAAHVSGDVVLSAVISKTGAVKNLTVVSGPMGLRENALGAVRMWRYRPYLLNGEPIDVGTNITVKFTITY
jgi:TonB family protein